MTAQPPLVSKWTLPHGLSRFGEGRRGARLILGALGILLASCGGETPGRPGPPPAAEDSLAFPDGSVSDVIAPDPPTDTTVAGEVKQPGGEGDAPPAPALDAARWDGDAAHPADGETAAPGELIWRRVPVEIDDPVVTGNSLMTPIDGVSFGYNPAARLFLTAFQHDLDDPTSASVWLFDETTERHYKRRLTGEPLPFETNFCNGETWCQFIHYCEESDEFVVLGPRAEEVMWVDGEGHARTTPISGDPLAPNGAIAYSFVFDWDSRRVLVYGYLAPWQNGNALYSLDLATGEWSKPVEGLPEVFDNCLAYDPQSGTLLSFGGTVSVPDPESAEILSAPSAVVTIIKVASGEVASSPLPEPLAARHSMSCAVHSVTGEAYVFGGAVVRSNIIESENDYHNDLWAFNTATGEWRELLPDGPLGYFEEHGEHEFLVGDLERPNFGKNKGRMMVDSDRLLLMGNVPGSATQLYSMELAPKH